MEDIRKYRKYYWLENYLDEISKNFQIRKYLKPEEFFAIVIWKRNASKTKIRNEIKNNGRTIRAITSEFARINTLEGKLNFLTSIRHIKISIASAILTVCYPKDFTIVDVRVLASLKKLGIRIDGDPSKYADAYLDYLKKCKILATKKYHVSLRNLDRCLWGWDFYKHGDDSGLQYLVKNLK